MIALTSRYFTKFPNQYIQSNIQKKFGVNKKFYIIYILIDRYRSIEGYSWLTIRKVLNFYGYKCSKNKPKAFQEILDVLQYMVDTHMISIQQNLQDLTYDTGIEIQIISENFDHKENFTKLTAYQLDTILNAEPRMNKENLLLTFIYISSFIGYRPILSNGLQGNLQPAACWCSIQKISADLSISKKSVLSCIDYLTTPSQSHNALLVKYDLGNAIKQPHKHATLNIYVLNQDGYQHEIQLAIQYLTSTMHKI